MEIRQLIALFCFPPVPVGSPLGTSFSFHAPGRASVPGTGKGHLRFPRAMCKQSSAEPSLYVIVSGSSGHSRDGGRLPLHKAAQAFMGSDSILPQPSEWLASV